MHSNKAPCIEAAWQKHHRELRLFLIKHCSDQDMADDVLQHAYAQALLNRSTFCQLASPKAWLFKVVKHQLIDRQRRDGRLVFGEVPEPPASENTNTAPVDSLASCIARALPHCNAEDQDILRHCDIEGVRQADYARQNGLSLPATKARLRRARQRLRKRLIAQCGIVFDEQGQLCCHLAQDE
ncbi:MAG: RNA polymerase sigma factor [Halomonas sp.]|nr:RNA polymerase sigma factor [Halomonas sp.]